MKYAVHIASVRSALHHHLILELQSSTVFELTEDATRSDVVIIDVVDGQDTTDLAARIPRTALCVVLSTAQGAQDHDATRADEHTALETLQGPWLILRCAPFGQELLTSLRYLYNETIFTSWGPGGAAWLDLHDVVAVMEAAVGDTTRRNVAYDLTGPEVLNMEQVCHLIEQHINSSVFYVELDEDQHVQAMARTGLSETYARRRAQYMHLTTQDGYRAQPTETILRALGRQPRPLRDYLLDPLSEIVAQARDQWG
ncbi:MULTISPECIES: hypothetical protein [Auritidibacter]|uniref:ADF-H domain-containing protein n=1 Tax=Auritidibacter ignavus TaxID=678932 RepID=A0AAJ6DF86_9MICC|nr:MULTISPECIES: hypothetical protein [Auritidibacter]WGH84469.1 hypothetical protein QDX20_02780 [Auritidibacter ignavus]WGH93793.1 hypothetical protein QDX21_03065 [Auritidibacter ignavus]WHS27390.1 hypothetical protein QM395_08370 [Auritidibacter ignavus]